MKRTGNVRNEIGVFYMNQAAALQSERVGKDLSSKNLFYPLKKSTFI